MLSFVQHRGEAIAEPTVLAGSLPPPAVSSRSRDWKSLVVERYRGVSADVTLRSPAVLVTVQQPQEWRTGRESRQRFNRGDTPGREISVTPSGEVCRWSCRAGESWTALWLDPALLGRVVTESGDASSGRAELLTARRSADAPR